MESITALVGAAYGLNEDLENTGISVCVALRLDMLHRLHSPETSSFVSSSQTLDWSQETGEESYLWDAMERKMRVDHPTAASLTSHYLAFPVSPGRSAAQYVLDHTRYLPRDLVRALTLIAELSKERGGRLDAVIVRAAIKDYSRVYFVREVRDALAGVLPPDGKATEKIQAFVEALQNVRTRHFTMRGLLNETSDEVGDSEVRLLLRQLYNVGAIGMRTQLNGMESTDFAYRNSGGVAFNANRDLMLHNALAEAWNKSRHRLDD